METFYQAFKKRELVILQILLVLFYICSLESLTVIEYLDAAKLFRYGRFVCYGLLGIFFLLHLMENEEKHSFSFMRLLTWIKDHLFFVLCTLICLGSAWASRTIEPLVLILMLGCTASFKKRSVFLPIVWTMTVFLGVIMLLSAMGVLENLTYESNRGLRQSMGFIYPLEFASLYLFTLLGGLYLLKINWKVILVLLLASLGIYLLSFSNFSFALALTAIIGAGVIAWKQDFFRTLFAEKWFLIFCAVMLLLAFLLPHLSIFYDEHNPLWFRLNSISHDRIWMGRNYYLLHTIHPFGRHNIWVGFGGTTDAKSIYEAAVQYNYVDISYLKNVFDYGYVFGILEYAAYMYILIHLSKKSRPVAFWLVLVVLAAGLTEPRLVQIAINPFILLASKGLCASNGEIRSLFERKRS